MSGVRGSRSGVRGDVSRTAEIGLTVNGHPYRVRVRLEQTLLDVLREELRLTGTKRGCDQGECGACTVHLDGQAVNACLVLAADADGSRVTTIEGLARQGVLHPLQRAFLDEGAVQCGYCTPGMIMQAAALLAANPKPSLAEIRAGLAGNLCRCTGYARIVKAVARAAEGLRASGSGTRGPGKGSRTARSRKPARTPKPESRTPVSGRPS